MDGSAPPMGLDNPFVSLRFVSFFSVPSVSDNLQSSSSVNFKDPIPSDSHTRLTKTQEGTCTDKNVLI